MEMRYFLRYFKLCRRFFCPYRLGICSAQVILCVIFVYPPCYSTTLTIYHFSCVKVENTAEYMASIQDWPYGYKFRTVSDRHLHRSWRMEFKNYKKSIQRGQNRGILQREKVIAFTPVQMCICGEFAVFSWWLNNDHRGSIFGRICRVFRLEEVQNQEINEAREMLDFVISKTCCRDRR